MSIKQFWIHMIQEGKQQLFFNLGKQLLCQCLNGEPLILQEFHVGAFSRSLPRKWSSGHSNFLVQQLWNRLPLFLRFLLLSESLTRHCHTRLEIVECLKVSFVFQLRTLRMHEGYNRVVIRCGILTVKLTCRNFFLRVSGYKI